MTIPRNRQISLEHTRVYHCMSRCVRRAFLCGKDRATGCDWSHRRQWIEDRLRFLANVFAIDLVAYAVMTNHYHVVLRVDVEAAAAMSSVDVADRWGAIYRVNRTGDPDPSSIAKWRERLTSISWFMRCLNEPLARMANREENITGQFWDGRFKCQPLLDDSALLRCMTYVDLNPIRAGIANTPEQSRHTSVHARIQRDDDHLAVLAGASGHIPISRSEYLGLVEWSGRIIRPDKPGYIGSDVPPIIQRLQMDDRRWLFDMQHFGRWYFRAIGSARSVQDYCAHLGQRWMNRTSHPPRGTPAFPV